MGKFSATIMIVMLSQWALAFQATCKIVSSSVRGIEKVTVSGPMQERHFRLRLFDRFNNQIETGACDFSGECYERDDRTLNFDVLTRLHVRIIEIRRNVLKMTVYPYVRQGVLNVECRIQR